MLLLINGADVHLFVCKGLYLYLIVNKCMTICEGLRVLMRLQNDFDSVMKFF